MRRPRSRQHLRRSKLPPAQGAQLRGAWVEGSRVRRLLSRLEAGAHAWRGTGLDPRIVEHRPNSQGRRFNEAGGARGRGARAGHRGKGCVQLCQYVDGCDFFFF